jgi:DNA ligase-1
MTETKIKAMLAHKYNPDKADYPAYIQPKLDGVRCLFTKDGAFSRAGNQFMNVEHIEYDLKPVFNRYPNLILDGELYNHGLKDDFNKIISLVKKKKPTKDDRIEAAQQVQYHMYDVASFPNATYTWRMGFINRLTDSSMVRTSNCLVITETKVVYTERWMVIIKVQDHGIL